MKKLVTIVVAALLVLTLVPSVFAAGVNDVEKEILAALREELKINGKTVAIPAEYVNQAENFFLSYETTEEQGKVILAKIKEGRDLILAQKNVDGLIKKGVLNLKDMPDNVKKQLLDMGTAACSEVGLKLVWDNTRIVITKADDSSVVYFSSEPIIKVTGEIDYAAVATWSAVAVAVIALVGFAVIYRRKTVA